MPFEQKLLLNIPPLLLCLIIVLIFILVAVFGLLITHRIISHHKRKIHNDIAGPIFSTLGVIYAVLLAFVVVITWENFDRSNLNVEKEAGCLASLYADAEAFIGGEKIQVRNLLKEYRRAVVEDEWNLLARGESSPLAEKALRKTMDYYAAYSPQTATEGIFLEESVKKLNDLGELRKMRILDARSGIHPILWLVLITGGLITIIFSFLFGTENQAAHMTMTVLLATVIALILFTIIELDYPFTGRISIGAGPFKQMQFF